MLYINVIKLTSARVEDPAAVLVAFLLFIEKNESPLGSESFYKEKH